MARGTKKDIPTQMCTMCGEVKPITVANFYKTYSALFKNSYDNRMCYCKECILGYANELNDKIYHDEYKSLYELCKLIDVYYNKDLYKSLKESAVESGDESSQFALYFQKINSLPQYRGKVFNDSELSEDAQSKLEEFENNDKELSKRWGKSWNREDLQWLEENYTEWLTHNDCEKLSVQRLVQMICIKELEIRKTREIGKPTDKLEKSLMELMNSSNLTPRTMSAMNETDSTKVFGLWLKDIEQYKPAEYFKDKKLYFDFDGILEYFNKFILRPMKNLLVGTRDFDKEFALEDENVEESED